MQCVYNDVCWDSLVGVEVVVVVVVVVVVSGERNGGGVW